VENYLDVSLWCLEQQWDDDKSMEVVFVNDGSTDSTLEKLQSFCRKHPDNTVLINKEENGGVAQARNEALKVAHGKWITFFDPDDALSAGAYQAMCNDYLDDNVDILSFETNFVLNADILPLPHYKGQIEWEGDGKDFFKKYRTSVVWTFFYSHNLLNKLNVSFPDLSYLEGELFNLDVFINDRIRVRRVDCKPYYYNSRPSSLSSINRSERDSKMIDDIMTALGYMEQKKQVQNDEVLVDSISSKQSEIARRLVPVYIRSNKVDKGSMDNIKQQLSQWNVYPYKTLNGGLKDAFYELLFRFPGLLVILRPLLLKFVRH
jgi:glycosyltransferase involved in cell wall biosynthesis